MFRRLLCKSLNVGYTRCLTFHLSRLRRDNANVRSTPSCTRHGVANSGGDSVGRESLLLYRADQSRVR